MRSPETIQTLGTGASPLEKSISCRAFKLHIRGGRDAHPTRVLLFFEIQFKCRTAYASWGFSVATHPRNTLNRVLKAIYEKA